MKIYCDMVSETKFLLYCVPQFDVTGLSMTNHDSGSFLSMLTNPYVQKVAKYLSVFFPCFFTCILQANSNKN